MVKQENNMKSVQHNYIVYKRGVFLCATYQIEGGIPHIPYVGSSSEYTGGAYAYVHSRRIVIDTGC